MEELGAHCTQCLLYPPTFEKAGEKFEGKVAEKKLQRLHFFYALLNSCSSTVRGIDVDFFSIKLQIWQDRWILSRAFNPEGFQCIEGDDPW